MTLDMYQERIMEHYENPYHRGTLEAPTLECHNHNPLCGDEVRIQARVDDQGRVAEAYFEGEGCVISLAAASLLMEAVEGKSLAAVKGMSRQEMLDLLGIRLTTMRVKCAMLPLRTLEKAIYLYEAQASAQN
jgi:nitrogen fixation NifU-like protein